MEMDTTAKGRGHGFGCEIMNTQPVIDALKQFCGLDLYIEEMEGQQMLYANKEQATPYLPPEIMYAFLCGLVSITPILKYEEKNGDGIFQVFLAAHYGGLLEKGRLLKGAPAGIAEGALENAINQRRELLKHR